MYIKALVNGCHWGGSENIFQWSTTLLLIKNRHWICLSMNIISYVLLYPPRNISYVITDAPSPLTFSPSSFCLSGSTPVRLLMDCFRSITVSSSDRELMEYSWPPHLMITDTDMAHTRALHTQTHTLLAGGFWIRCSEEHKKFWVDVSSYSVTIKQAHQRGKGGERGDIRMIQCKLVEIQQKTRQREPIVTKTWHCLWQWRVMLAG